MANDLNDKERVNIFGIKVNIDDDIMETVAPNLETLSEDEKPPEQVGFDPFSDNIYSSGKQEELNKEEEIESFVLDEDDKEKNENPTRKDIPYNKDAIV